MNRGTPSDRSTRIGVLLAVGLLAPVLMNAQIDRSAPPKPGPAPAVDLGEHHTFTLKNGFRVIVVENHKLPMVNVQVRFDIPPIVQGEKAGYIDFLGDLLASGTATRTKAQMDEQVDQLGATLAATNDGLYASSLKKNLPALMTLVQDVVTGPTFQETEFEKVRTRTRSAIQQRKEEPDAIAEVVGRAVTYGRVHPYGEVMTERTLESISTKHIKAYYDLFFRPEKGYLVFVGDITEKEAKDLAQEHFGGWRPDRPVTSMNDDGSESMEGLGKVRIMPKLATPGGVRRVFVVDRPGSPQSVVRVGFPLNLQPRDIRALSAQVLNTILGGGVFNARLMQNLREDKGWTYGAYSTMESDRFNGHFQASVSVRTAVTDSAVAEIIKELERLRNEPVSDEELDLAKRYMAGSFARGLEDPRTVARFALNTYLNELAPDHYATYLERLEGITTVDVQAAAQAFLHPDQAIILVVGDLASFDVELAALSRDRSNPIMQLDENGAPWEEDITPVTDRKAEDIIEGYLKAIGGRNLVGQVKDMHRVMTVQRGDKELKVSEWFGPDGHYRSETTLGDQRTELLVHDGLRAGRTDAQGQVELTDVDLQDLQFNAVPVRESDLVGRLDRMVLAGRTEVEGKDAYKVILMTQHGTTVADYFDVATGLKVKRVEQKFMNGSNQRITTTYGDHRSVGGVQFPYRIGQTGGTLGRVQFTVTELDVNKGVLPALFTTGLPPIVEPTEFETDPDGYNGIEGQ
ncbi:MAG: insulinase family protein [Flavobacteriales bacterium]|nr:insulinase family protein [Flavobacteriales bacterium]